MKRQLIIHATILLGVTAAILCDSLTATAQIPTRTTAIAGPNRYATLEDQLVNRLHATTDQQRAYLHYIVKQVKLGKLDIKLVVAMERYALRRRPDFPMPFFERAMKAQADKIGLALPPIQSFLTTRTLRS
ncbi:hypothetical protein CA13_07730 [Planctomycetes bacterium CA13]|uniref:Uncharacterized protein n=1 Tax=Novipirellula herctigrandis TaxID=2527986 RepID=A0A5C5YY00_9BACT|nr:hypothetical protein CA13_07730 [Planctomycetes bacterium CA13]